MARLPWLLACEVEDLFAAKALKWALFRSEWALSAASTI